MPITVQWDNEDRTIVRTDIRGEWTWEDFHQSLDAVHDIIDAVDHPVAVINVRHGDARSPVGNPLPHYRRAARDIPDNQLLTINVSPQKSMNMVMGRVLSALFPFMKSRFLVVNTLDEARALVKERLALAER